MPRTEQRKRTKEADLQKSASECHTLHTFCTNIYLVVVMLISNAVGPNYLPSLVTLQRMPFCCRNSNRKTIFCQFIGCAKQKITLVAHILKD